MIYLEKPEGFNSKFDCVACYCIHDGKFLILRRHKDKEEGEKYGLPAGKVHEGESLKQAVVREVKEETSIDIHDPKFFKSVYVRYPGYDFMFHMFYIYLDENYDVKVKSDEHHDFRWVTYEEIQKLDNLMLGFKEVLEMFNNEVGFGKQC